MLILIFGAECLQNCKFGKEPITGMIDADWYVFWELAVNA